MSLKEEIKKIVKGDVADDEETLVKYSRDASLLEIRPKLVVFPKNSKDVQALVKFVSEKKKNGENIYLTPRAGGSDMTGGPLGESVILDFTRYMNHLRALGRD